MRKTTSLDLRERILDCYDKEDATRSQVAKRFRDHPVDLISLGGQKEDWQTLRKPAHLSADLEAVDVGQTYVQDKQVRCGLLATKCHGFKTPRRAAHRVVLCSQGVVEDIHDVWIILGDENVKRG